MGFCCCFIKCSLCFLFGWALSSHRKFLDTISRAHSRVSTWLPNILDRGINFPLNNIQRKIKLTRWIVYEWGKPPRQKPHQVILRSSLLRIHYYHNKRLQVKESQYFIPIYSWTLTVIPNWTCSVVIISPFQFTALST